MSYLDKLRDVQATSTSLSATHIQDAVKFLRLADAEIQSLRAELERANTIIESYGACTSCGDQIDKFHGCQCGANKPRFGGE